MHKYNAWFESYVSPFKLEKHVVMLNRLKHVKDVCDISSDICRKTTKDKKKQKLAHLVALFHDLGRFYQYKEAKTFDDEKSFDHANRSVEILEQQKVLHGLPDQEKNCIISAIFEHNKKNITPGYDEETTFQIQLIRDSDKISNYSPFLRGEFSENLPETGNVSTHLISTILKGELISFQNVKTTEDEYLYYIAWMNDINLQESKKILVREKFLDKLTERLPLTKCVIDMQLVIKGRLLANP